jgi:hypothetical protein
MKTIKETMKQAGYTYVRKSCNGAHILRNSEGDLELFSKNKNFAGWGIIYKNTHLEFCCSVKE